MKKKKITELLIFIVGTELVGALSALLSGDFSAVYDEFEKPPLSPPALVFPIAWAILYALMGISAFLIFTARRPQQEKNSALTFYGVQLSLNFMWSILNFRLRSPFTALIDIVLLDIIVMIMTIKFYRIRRSAAYLNFPYIAWLAYATYLNAGTVILN